MVLNHSRVASHGTTLIELVVSVGLFVVLVGVSSTMTIDTWATYLSLRGQSTLTGSLIDAQDRLVSLLATTTATPASVSINGVAYTAGPSTFIATIPSIDSTGAAQGTSTDTLVYTQTAEGLVEILDATGGVRSDHNQIVLDPSLVSVQFTLEPASASQVQATLAIVLTASQPVPQRTLQETVSRVLVLRNLQ